MLLDEAIEAAGQLRPEKQDEIARAIFEYLDARSKPYVLSESEREAIRESREQATAASSLPTKR